MTPMLMGRKQVKFVKALKSLLKWFVTLSPLKLAFPIIVFTVFFEFLSVFGNESFGLTYFKFRSFISALESKFLDYKFRYRDPDLGPTDVVLLGADEQSIRDLGRWPWNRTRFADMVHNLNKAGAKVIAFDAVFDTEDPSSNLPVMKTLLSTAEELEKKNSGNKKSKQNLDSSFLDLLREKTLEADSDSKFVDAVKQYPNVILGYFWYMNEEDAKRANINFDDLLFQIGSSSFNPEYIYRDGSPVEKVPEKLQSEWRVGYGMVTNREALSGASSHHAYFSTEPDHEDGVFRRMPLIMEYSRTFFPSLPLKSVALFLDKKVEARIVIDEDVYASVDTLKLEGMPPIPIDPGGTYKINWRGPSYSFPYYTASDVVLGKETVTETRRQADGTLATRQVSPEEAFKGKIVMFGGTAVGIGDIRTVPVEGAYPGPEIQVTVVDNILRSNFLKDTTRDLNYKTKFSVGLFLIGLFYAFLLSRFRALSGAFVLVFALTGYIVVDYFYFFLKLNQISSVFLPLVMFLMCYMVVTIYKFMTEEKERSKVKNTFSKYVSPAIVDEMLKDPSKLKLEGEKRELTVMFSDVRGFTTISEKLDAVQVGNFLNNYLSPMTELVYQTKGTLDKYMGDAIMAFWGAPIPFDDHAQQACKCALLMMEKLKEIQATYREQGLPAIDVGIGLNTGEMSVGNMGSNIVFSYTVLGDSVNLASRLEGINKSYHTNIIISEFTYAKVKDTFIAREVDRVKVKGKNKPVSIYELLAEKEKGLPSQVNEAVAIFQEGLKYYYDRRFPEAMTLFQKGLKVRSEDGPTQTFVERCEYFAQNDPGADWDGSWTMTSK